jgi:periplasmic copper chaperone A
MFLRFSSCLQACRPPWLVSAAALTLAFAGLSSHACADPVRQGTLEIETVYAWDTPPGAKVAGAFMRIHNRGQARERLVRASTSMAGTTELHTHTSVLGIMRMRAVTEIVIEAGQTVALEPGGLHVMLFDLKQPLTDGLRVPIELHFERAGVVSVTATVRARTASPPR